MTEESTSETRGDGGGGWKGNRVLASDLDLQCFVNVPNVHVKVLQITLY